MSCRRVRGVRITGSAFRRKDGVESGASQSGGTTILALGSGPARWRDARRTPLAVCVCPPHLPQTSISSPVLVGYATIDRDPHVSSASAQSILARSDWCEQQGFHHCPCVPPRDTCAPYAPLPPRVRVPLRHRADIVRAVLRKRAESRLGRPSASLVCVRARVRSAYELVSGRPALALAALSCTNQSS
ncbi:hypothetical protein MVEN_01715000 [Mycena venus]|uniref:Uncharacterized protein n=1 Tax=Mycena venus TaxID=2733690 RepID=A0A8H6XM64_9AGAR|nr:hypothetical protein MVEN_01715000 [Mycena venus]